MPSVFKKISSKKETKTKRFFSFLKRGVSIFYHKFSFKGEKEKKPRKLNIIVASVLALIGIFVVYRFSIASYNFIKNFEVKDLVFILGTEIKTDKNGYTNFLLLGKGGGIHDGPELTDTIIIASLDQVTQSVVMLSIPRDFYVQTEYYGSSRINEIYRNVQNRLIHKKYTKEEAQTEAINILKNKIEEIVELDLQYYAVIDFNGFKSVVDALDGIEVTVEQNIRDTTYPADIGWGYQTFEIKKGKHHLDGATALKYARSRHTTSDFDRALRQQKVIQAIKNKALELKTLTSPTKIRELLEIIDKNFESDLEIGEIITLAKVSSKFPRQNVISKVLVDEPSWEGGFLATPPRDNYGGAFVLIPYIGDLSEIHRYARLLFKNREIYLENAKIEVQNGTNHKGIAGKIGTQLERYSFNVLNITNTDNKKKYEKTQIIAHNAEKFPETTMILPILIAGEAILKTNTGTNLLEKRITETKSTETLETSESSENNIDKPDIIIILGEDYTQVAKKLLNF